MDSMKSLLFFIAFIILVFAVGWNLVTTPITPPGTTPSQDIEEVTDPEPSFSVVTNNLYVPWGLAFLEDGNILVSERGGNVLLVTEEGEQFIHRFGSYESGEGGLLGIAVHPNFLENKFLYFYYTYQSIADEGVLNRVERYTYRDEKLTEPVVIIDNIPGAIYHDGGRIAFGPDTHLYITTGDARRPKLAQDLNSLAGKILRINNDGSIPRDNPFANSPIYSYGHRNPQGLAWDDEGRLWSTEHGRSGVASGFDEINLIVAGGNYGWPDSQGNTVLADTVGPKLHSGATETWAPASATFYDGSLYFGGLRGEALYEAVLDGTTVVDLKKHYHKKFGRIRTVEIGPDNMLYITTSNRDGRGTILDNDDKLLRLFVP